MDKIKQIKYTYKALIKIDHLFLILIDEIRNYNIAIGEKPKKTLIYSKSLVFQKLSIGNVCFFLITTAYMFSKLR